MLSVLCALDEGWSWVDVKSPILRESVRVYWTRCLLTENRLDECTLVGCSSGGDVYSVSCVYCDITWDSKEEEDGGGVYLDI